MNTTHERLAALGVSVPELLIPQKHIDISAWAIIACDQFTQDRSYWEQRKNYAGNKASTLNIILPEVYLEDSNKKDRIQTIRATMKDYLTSGIFQAPQQGIMYIERDTPLHSGRQGLVLAVDLDRYRWQPEERPLIRATEGTVPERLPPRMEIRRGAEIESPHILLLIDDKENKLMSAAKNAAASTQLCYESNLEPSSGHIKAWLLDTDSQWSSLADELEHLATQAATRYATHDPDPFLFAVGDGNHSLATAKAVWEEYKADHAGEAGLDTHPARYALVEVENIYDEAIEFEPIHRALFGISIETVASAFSSLPDYDIENVEDLKTLKNIVEMPCEGTVFALIAGTEYRVVRTSKTGLSTESLQPIMDNLIHEQKASGIDYLHGADETIRVAQTANTVGVLLPPVGKADLFMTVARSGPLPRKSFSMGEACEKRYYLECRKLFG